MLTQATRDWNHTEWNSDAFRATEERLNGILAEVNENA
jgi:hypothetical protein